MKKITRADAIRIFNGATEKDDPYWENVTSKFLDDPDDFDAELPTIEDVFAALGVTKEEYDAAMAEPEKGER